MERLVWQKLNDPGGVYYPSALGALNEAQRLFALITLSLETTAPFALAANTFSSQILPQLPDLILVRRVYNSLGAQLRPVTIGELAALDSTWQLTMGTPTRYVTRGINWIGVYPQPETDDTLSIVYARAPQALTGGDSVPEIRSVSHIALVNFAAWALRQPEGAQEFAKFAGYQAEFMMEAKKVADLVRERNRDLGFETVQPFELTRVK